MTDLSNNMSEEKSKKSKKGKASRAAGNRFEVKVRKDLELKGWVIDKWTNNVELHFDTGKGFIQKLVKAKAKWSGPGRPMMIGAGFPDFICFRPLLDKFSKYKSQIPLVEIGRENLISDMENEIKEIYEVIGVESKMDGYLSKEEKEKCRWLLKNNIFSKILVASKGTKRGQIVYKEFEK